MFVAQHADGEMHFFAHFFRRRRDRVEARRQRAQQRQQLFCADGRRIAGNDGVNWRARGVLRGAARGNGVVQFGVFCQRGVALHELRRVLRDFALVNEGVAQGFVADGCRTVQFKRGEDGIDARRVVFAPNAECVARLIVEARTGEVKLDVAHVFVRVASGDFLPRQQRRAKRVVAVVGSSGCGRGGACAATRRRL